jgi:hypothetical protein
VCSFAAEIHSRVSSSHAVSTQSALVDLLHTLFYTGRLEVPLVVGLSTLRKRDLCVYVATWKELRTTYKQAVDKKLWRGIKKVLLLVMPPKYDAYLRWHKSTGEVSPMLLDWPERLEAARACNTWTRLDLEPMQTVSLPDALSLRLVCFSAHHQGFHLYGAK